MACVVMLVIIVMSIVLGAELGPKADPTTTTYVPRPGVVLLLPLRAAAGHQAGGADAAGDDRRADDLHDPAVPAAVLRPRPGAAARAPADRDDRRHLHDRRDGLPDLPRRGRRLAERDRRHERRGAQFEAGQAGRRAVGLPGLPQDRRERQRRARARPDRDRRQAAQGRRSRARSRTRRRRCRPSRGLPEEKKTALVDFLAQLQAASSRTAAMASAAGPDGHARGGRRCGRCSTASPASTTCMNSVMTAGLHHRWRARAADLAARRARRPRARRRDRHGRPGDRAGAPRRPGGEVVGSDFSEEMLDARAARRRRRVALGVGQRARAALRRRRASTRRRSASARATSPTSTAGWREMARVVRPGGRVVVLEITTPQRAAAVDVLLGLVRPRRAARSAGWPATRRLHLPAELGQALPGARRRWPRGMAAAGLSDVRWILTAGGIIALHAGTVP